MAYYNISCEAAYAACLKAVGNSGYGMRQTSPPSFMEVQTRERLKGWDGVLSVIITPEGSGCEISINASTTAMNFNVGMMAKLEAEGAAGLASGKLTRLIDAAVLSAPKASQQKVAEKTATGESGSKSNMALLDELTKLKALLDGGVLTQEEFDQMKKKLLS